MLNDMSSVTYNTQVGTTLHIDFKTIMEDASFTQLIQS